MEVKQGKVVSITLDDIPKTKICVGEGMRVLYNDEICELGTNRQEFPSGWGARPDKRTEPFYYTVDNETLNDKTVNWEDLRVLAIVDQEEGRVIDVLKYSQWETSLANGLVDSDKAVDYESWAVVAEDNYQESYCRLILDEPIFALSLPVLEDLLADFSVCSNQDCDITGDTGEIDQDKIVDYARTWLLERRMRE